MTIEQLRSIIGPLREDIQVEVKIPKAGTIGSRCLQVESVEPYELGNTSRKREWFLGIKTGSE